MQVFSCKSYDQCDYKQRKNKFQVKGNRFNLLSIYRGLCNRRRVAPILAFNGTSSNYMTNKNIMVIFPCL